MQKTEFYNIFVKSYAKGAIYLYITTIKTKTSGFYPAKLKTLCGIFFLFHVEHFFCIFEKLTAYFMKTRLLKKIRQSNFEFWGGGFQKKPMIIDNLGIAHVMPFFMVKEKYCNIRLLLKSNVLPNKLNLLISEKLKLKLNELSKKL